MDPAVGVIDSAYRHLTDLLKLFIAVAIVTHNQMRQHIHVHREGVFLPPHAWQYSWRIHRGFCLQVLSLSAYNTALLI